MKYDPLALHISPHITLVFPFESSISSSELSMHLLECIKDIGSFEIELNGFGVDEYGYLYLKVRQGSKEIIDLHDKLYTSILEGYLRKEFTYIPHITVGKLEDSYKLGEALKEAKKYEVIFRSIVSKISIENISDNEDSIIESEYELSS